MLTMLVIDDDRLNCDLIQSVFSRHGYHVMTALSGREGVEMFDTHHPSVTVLDLRMPQMDGLAVLKEIRAHDPYAPVVMLGGGATDLHENLARELGVTDFLRKGLSLDVLIRSVNHAAQLSVRVPVPSGALPGGESIRDKDETILVVDDEPLVRDLLIRFLSMRGYRVSGAASGEEALDLVDRLKPELVLLDLAMPEMTGVDVIRALQAKAYGGGIVVLTGSQNQEDLQDTWDLGVQEVLFKPVDLDRLLTAVQVVLVCREC
ncbi:hypothetical protein YTPLAS18_34500 [Nitrospira sp.]|nr:hypothetical protein YTPLAS18_34500 [Nitrospira sp.]